MRWTRVLAIGGIVFGLDHVGWANDQSLYRSAHYLGRGNTGIADTDDQEAIYYNPAGLAQGTGIYKRFLFASPQVELSSRTRTIYSRLEVEDKGETETLKKEVGKPLHLGVSSLSALVFRRAALGVYADSRVNALVRKHPDFGGLETLNADFNTNQVLTFSIAESYLGDHLLIGATGKYIRRSESDLQVNIIDADQLKELRGDNLTQTGSGRGVDLGMMWKSSKSPTFTEHTFGLTLNNVGDVTFVPDAGSEELAPFKQTLNFGYCLGLGTAYSRLKLLVDYRDVTGNAEDNALKRLHLGSEVTFANFIGVTGGFNQGYPTAGFYVNTYVVRVDLAMTTEEMGDRVGTYPDQRYVIRIMAGI